MGLWMPMHLPALRHRLLLASSHARTSGSMASVYRRFTNSIAWRVSFELIVIVLPSLATYEPPYDHRIERRVTLASPLWPRAVPNGCPMALPFLPMRSQSSQGSGFFFPVCSSRSVRTAMGNGGCHHGSSFHLPRMR